MISRQWRGLVKMECEEQYIEHLRSETFPVLGALPGFLRASILRRPLPEGVEFLIVTEWQSLESIRAFAGENVESAVVPPKAQGMLVEYDRVARHFEILQ